GTRIGDKVLLVALSNGATFGLWSAMQPEWRDRIGAVVLISPNIRPFDPNARILLWPWGEPLADIILGDTREWEPYTEDHGRYSTNRYPTRVLPQMMASVDLLSRQDPAQLRAPVLTFYSEQDDVISPQAVREYHERIPTRKRLVDVGNVGDPNNHLIEGDALSPERTMPTVEEVLAFIQNNPESLQ
ncbi:MAG: alpha/beta hydrolase, partial [Rhodothermales bacterium]|nr:alpha/beta hydrolase [Rhodothermales bacterium]